jgi:hypothetical protein
MVATVRRSLSKFYSIKYYKRNIIGPTGLNNFTILTNKHKKQPKQTLKNEEMIFKNQNLIEGFFDISPNFPKTELL